MINTTIFLMRIIFQKINIAKRRYQMVLYLLFTQYI